MFLSAERLDGFMSAVMIRQDQAVPPTRMNRCATVDTADSVDEAGLVCVKYLSGSQLQAACTQISCVQLSDGNMPSSD